MSLLFDTTYLRLRSIESSRQFSGTRTSVTRFQHFTTKLVRIHSEYLPVDIQITQPIRMALLSFTSSFKTVAQT